MPSFTSFYMTCMISSDSIIPTYLCAFAVINFLVGNGGTFSWCENHWAIEFLHYILILSYCGSASVDGRLGYLTWLEPTWAISVDRKSLGTTSWFVIACQGFTFSYSSQTKYVSNYELLNWFWKNIHIVLIDLHSSTQKWHYDILNPSSWKTMSHLSCIVNAMTAMTWRHM